MSIASEIERLKNAKTSIASAIEEKGVAVPAETSIDEYGNYVSSIPSGDYATKEELEALSNTANAADRVKYESGVLKTLGGTEIVTGNARIATGSYVGTGYAGNLTINLPFEPKVMFISNTTICFLSGGIIFSFMQGTHSIQTYTYDESTGNLTTFADNTDKSGVTYNYVVIG